MGTVEVVRIKEIEMIDPHTPLPPATRKPGEVLPDVPETEAPDILSPEGPLPGLPVATDPLMQPMPRPAPREVPPID